LWVGLWWRLIDPLYFPAQSGILAVGKGQASRGSKPRRARSSEAGMGRYGIPENPALETNSRVWRWCLESFWGYQVLEVRRRPKAGWFGSLAYDESYLMLRRGQEIN